MVFLSDIFGVVDGVLHGTGSQIMGSMFAVFNSAVLALGGIVVMYTLLVSTMNTAHEGQMLGQKWSSIWIPARATMGLALLIPKASGYCLMQVFVMWVVVQGVGAADKIWDAALDYLNRGGVIVQAQMNPTTSMLNAQSSGIPFGAQAILAGQVCMLGLQNQLQNQLQAYQSQKPDGPCPSATGTLKDFCNSSVPDFIGSVNAIDYQNKHMTLINSGDVNFSLPMPNFDSAPYNALNGICGILTWNSFPVHLLDQVKTIPSVTASDLAAASMSRVVAIQQMYLDLASVAQLMVGNAPGLVKQNNQNANTPNYSPNAIAPFGIPELAMGTPCTTSTADCILWGTDANTSSAPLLNGTEFPGALLDYNAIMMPTLNLIAEAQNGQTAEQGRAFIQNAENQGWLMAGSYFFNLVGLNANASANNGNLVDTGTGLDKSLMDPLVLSNAFGSQGSACPGSYYNNLCVWLDNDGTLVQPIIGLINNGPGGQAIPQPSFNSNSSRTATTGIGASTVYGYTNNSTILQLPGQPGNTSIYLPLNYSANIPLQMHFRCGFVSFLGCLGSLLGDIFYNQMIVPIYNFFLSLLGGLINQTIDDFILVPLQGMAAIFHSGLDIINTPGVNPVIALSNMGTFYINFASQLWLYLLNLSITSSLIPIFGAFIFALLTMSMPIILAWTGIMLQIGFITAYYVPILPYMIFTFGAIAWLMAVIEAMVAAPIVALGVTHPEGHDAFGKGEQAVMILMNVFLRPSMMIIGYIAAISLTYVSVWVINAGFSNAISFLGNPNQTTGAINTVGGGTVTGGYNSWAGTFAYFFAILIYTMLYLIVVQKAFTLISALPDKILRWIGGQQESYGADTAQWGQELQGKVSEAGKDTAAGQAQISKKLEAKVPTGGSTSTGGGSVDAAGAE